MRDSQVGVACAFVHTLLQVPQSESVLSGVSQPLFLSPSQSPQPDAQVGSQPVAVHSFEAWFCRQVSPHLRQLSLVPSAISQPSVGSLLQSA